MKKKFLAVVLGMTMMMSLVACGGTDNIETDGGDVSVTVEADGVGDGEDVGDGTTIEDSGEMAEVEVLEDGSYDYDKDYTVDMLVEAMPQDNVYMYVETMGIGLGVGKSGENATIVINMEDANTGSEMGMDLYIMGQDMYSYVHDSSQNMSVYQHAVVSAEEGGTGDIVSSLTEETDMNLSNITSVEYVETLVENGIAYDVVQVEETVEGVSDGVTVEINGEMQEPMETYTAVSSYYIDVETGIVDRVVSVTDGVETIMNIDVIDGIELPAGFSENEVVEVPAEDLMMQLFGVMMMTESTGAVDDVPEAGVEVETEDGAAIDGFEEKDAK